MSPIQFILISSLLIIALYFFVRLRNRVFDVVLLFLFFITAIIFILFPSLTNIIAHKLGVGRGADLIFYLCIVFFVFIVFKLYSKIRKLEQMLTEITRDKAMEEYKNETTK